MIGWILLSVVMRTSRPNPRSFAVTETLLGSGGGFVATNVRTGTVLPVKPEEGVETVTSGHTMRNRHGELRKDHRERAVLVFDPIPPHLYVTLGPD